MANILEFLRGVLTDDSAQGAFRSDPAAHLEACGFGDLTGEDIVEGISVLRRSLPDELASALGAFDDEDHLPPVRPGTDESELDAAVRLLAYAVDQVPSVDGAVAHPPPEPEPEPEAEAEPEPEAEHETEPEPQWAAEPDTEPMAASASGAVSAPPMPSGSVTVDVSTLPSVAAFAESMAAVASDARDRFDEAIRQVVADAAAQAGVVAARYDELLAQAEADANGIRADSDAYVAERLAEADADREAARQYLDRTRQESDEMLERARQQVEDAREQADDLLAHSRAEAEHARAEIEARQAEIRDAERQLKERLAGIDSLFRTVLRDDEATASGDE